MSTYLLVMAAILVSVVLKLLVRAAAWFPVGGSRTLRRWQWIMQQIADQRNGSVTSGGWRRISCRIPNGEIQARVHGAHSHIKVRIQRPIPFAASFYHTPRLAYAFLEAFLKPALRIEPGSYVLVPATPDVDLSDLKNSPLFVRSLEQLDAHGFSIFMDREGLTLSRRVRNRHLGDLPFLEILEAAESLAEVCAAPVVQIPVHEVPANPNCAYCKESILDGAEVTTCSLCKTPHHRECFDLNGGCSVFGCRSRQHVNEPIVVRT